MLAVRRVSRVVAIVAAIVVAVAAVGVAPSAAIVTAGDTSTSRGSS